MREKERERRMCLRRCREWDPSKGKEKWRAEEEVRERGRERTPSPSLAPVGKKIVPFIFVGAQFFVR